MVLSLRLQCSIPVLRKLTIEGQAKDYENQDMHTAFKTIREVVKRHARQLILTNGGKKNTQKKYHCRLTKTKTDPQGSGKLELRAGSVDQS